MLSRVPLQMSERAPNGHRSASRRARLGLHNDQPSRTEPPAKASHRGPRAANRSVSRWPSRWEPTGKVVQSWVPAHLAEQLKAQAELERRSVSSTIRLAIEARLHPMRSGHEQLADSTRDPPTPWPTSSRVAGTPPRSSYDSTSRRSTCCKSRRFRRLAVAVYERLAAVEVLDKDADLQQHPRQGAATCST